MRNQYNYHKTNDYLMDNVRCIGDEENISQCKNNGMGKHNCGNNEAAGVLCKGRQFISQFKVKVESLSHQFSSISWLSDRFELKWNRQAQNGTNPGLFQIRFFSLFWLGDQYVLLKGFRSMQIFLQGRPSIKIEVQLLNTVVSLS